MEVGEEEVLGTSVDNSITSEVRFFFSFGDFHFIDVFP